MRRYLRARGYAVSLGKADYTDEGFHVVRFDNYSQYVSVQTEANKQKIKQVWADEATTDLICDYIRRKNPNIKAGLCHGSRNGTEVRWFSEKLGIPMTGTDISETAPEFGLVKWDFHDTNPDWIGKFDFIYTNSHDHAFDPKKAFDAWVGQLAPGGRLIIEHTEGHAEDAITPTDPFGVAPQAFPYVILQFGSGRYAVTECIRPEHKKGGYSIWIFVIQQLNG